MKHLTLTCIAAFLAPLLVAGCGSARRAEPVTESTQNANPKLVEGQRAFMATCYQCHPGGQAGLGPSLNNRALPASAIRYQVRTGLGAMPAFDEHQIPDPQLDAIVTYLQALRKGGK